MSIDLSRKKIDFFFNCYSHLVCYLSNKLNNELMDFLCKEMADSDEFNLDISDSDHEYTNNKRRRTETRVLRYPRSRYCAHKNCALIANFGFSSGNDTTKYCSEHKKEGMTECYRPKCVEPMCDKYAGFSKQKNGRPTHCSIHKTIEMFGKGTCQFEDCSVHASFDLPNRDEQQGNFKPRKGKYCKTHSLIGMVNVYSPRCKYSGCQIRATCDNYTRCPKHRNM